MIAQFATPPEGLGSGPMALLGLLFAVYVVLWLIGRVVGGQGNAGDEEAFDRAAFVVALAAGAYTLGLAIYAIAMRSELVWELIKIMLIIFGFFALLLLFMLLWEMLIGAVGRSRSGRRRRRAGAATDDPAPAAPPSAGPQG